ncbi:hypothetical protein [Cupriavidus agavae]|uniref:Uncharacterized protein n=1 Tax=Cupriavidus agavae TaxID=1001822 RepID=A0A4Q7RZ20_9BURK|nr:hypothetical protein [Cupriavidus agavae]RZT39151.1 hypothetical protein EV147_2345 [Cupriavidus agavae]
MWRRNGVMTRGVHWVAWLGEDTMDVDASNIADSEFINFYAAAEVTRSGPPLRQRINIGSGPVHDIDRTGNPMSVLS